MKIYKKTMLVLILLFTIWIPSLHSASMDEYVGRWKGDVSVVSANESEIVNLTIVLAENNGIISGTVTDNETVSPQSFEGNINNGVLTFQFPNMGPGDPDCLNWNVSATASLNTDSNVMHLSASGIICSQKGGESGSFSGNLIKQKTSLQPILSILLKGNNQSYTCPSGTQTILWKGHVWQRCADGKQYSWTQANEYCQALKLGGISDWRLPTESEAFDLDGAPELMLFESTDNLWHGSQEGYAYWTSTYSGSSNGESLYGTVSFTSATGGPSQVHDAWYETYLLGAICVSDK